MRKARICYDHLGGALGTALHRRLLDLGRLRRTNNSRRCFAGPEPGAQRKFECKGMNAATLAAMSLTARARP